MIIVIADDITGAAELAGIGLRYNLRVVISDNAPATPETDLLVIYTNTRSMPKGEAVEVMNNLTKKARRIQPTLFYKKTDSVLRGHVLAELEVQMNALGMDKALLVPANPLLDRTIKEGHYYVQGQLIHHTSFSADPEFPVRSSRIKEMLGSGADTVQVLACETPIPQGGICVGEAQTIEDIAQWARYSNEPMLFAGGASFFAALLDTMYEPIKRGESGGVQLSLPLLFVSGTTFQKNVNRIKEYNDLVSYMPAALYAGTLPASAEIEQWSKKVAGIVAARGQAIMAIGEQGGEKADPNYIRAETAEAVRQVLEQATIRELLVEGGATAYSIIQNLGWHSFVPTEELAQGIVRMQVEGAEGVHLTIKPGSYEWPPEWRFKA